MNSYKEIYFAQNQMKNDENYTAKLKYIINN